MLQLGRKTTHMFIPLLIAVLAAVVYSNSFTCAWQLDDFHSIVDFDYEAATLKSLFELRRQRALGFISFWLNYRLCGYEVFGWHVVNLLIHVFNALVVYVLSVKLFSGGPEQRMRPQKETFAYVTAAVIAAVFAVHPIQTQAVTYVVQRLELLGTAFVLLTFLFFLNAFDARAWGRRIAWGAAGIVTLVLGAITRETIVVAPALLCAYIVIVRVRTWRSRVVAVCILGLIALLTVVGVLVMFKALTFTPSPHLSVRPFEILWRDAAQSPMVYYSTQVRVILRFLRLCVVPYGQCVEFWMNPSASFLDWRVIAAAGIQLLLLACACIAWRRRPMALFGVAWFYIFLAPSSLMPNGIFEHRLYGPMLGLLFAIFIPLGQELLDQSARVRRALAVVALSLAVCLILSFSFLAHIRNEVWQTELSLWRDGVRVSPENWRANGNYGYALMNEGRLEEARHFLEKSFRLNSNVWLVANNLGILYSYVGEIPRSIGMYEYALKQKPGNRMVLGNLGAAYLLADRITEATNLLARARTPESFVTLGDFFMKALEYEQALRCFERVLKKVPDEADALAGKARALNALGRGN